MHMLRSLGIGICAAIVVCTTSAFAQLPATAEKSPRPASAKTQGKPEPLEIKLRRNKIVVVEGKESVQSAATAKPGEVLEEVATYTNNSASPLKNLVATLPVPANTELLLDSVKPGDAMASVDGANFANMPLKRKTRLANGLEGEETVPVSEYRYLRWNPVELAAEKSLVFSARFKVADTSVLTAPPASK